MAMTLTDFAGNSGIKFVDKTVLEVPASFKVPDRNDVAKKSIINEEFLWDMRVWKKYHDYDEVLEWIKNNCRPNNCGGTAEKIKYLLNNGLTEVQVADIILQNDKKKYANRLAQCFLNPNTCPRYRDKVNYPDCHCEDCENK